ncbi:UTP--glucose-1-phosphate uridylyltransferase GalU [Haliovirga abyssi]|uniref:UTP--glucose-1-phosphate uridylyltransferase n=1 Tax=Haliovirga abyssi TaxID=2996794 RepID=A0AAU9D7X0_9FUSO|nr:UTP--glucose-1-phosphate uridylyltransferase GalU [Haliovirga abyssi]BDU50673.1 UTP--glucose-1-phosphate uridylyltransferase [Haliovirga abyssi]
MQKIRKAVIPAAGLGTRFLPATKAQPKEMLPIVDKPAIQYIVEEIVKSGITDITIVTGRNKRALEDHFDYSVELEYILEKKNKDKMLKVVREISEYANIYYIRQKEPLGLGHAILKAKHHIGHEPFVVVLGDDIVYNDVPVVKQMLDVREKYKGGSVIGVQQVPDDKVSSYGIIKPGNRFDERTVKVEDFIEKPTKEEAPSNYACLGRYILEPQIFEFLEKIEPGKGGEIQLTDAILEMIKYGDKVLAYDFVGERYDTGDKLGFIKANIEYGLRHEEVGEGLREYLKELAEKL